MLRAPRLLAAAGMLACACGAADTTFSDANGRAHLRVLSGTLGSRWVGTAANARARQYLVEQLSVYGFTVHAEPVTARRPDLGLSARVVNIVAVRSGERPDAIALVSHYDSAPDGPGAADDGFGVAVTVEAARVLAGDAMRHTLMVLITDGEEAGLMGAAAAAEDPDVGGRIRAYLNIEAVGSSGAALLFETGPGNAWLTDVWARHATRPRGSSLGIEVYRRLPNDTDFSMFKRRGIPGLNFAIAGDGYAYHTDRDTENRIPNSSLRQAGDNAVAIVRALDTMDLSDRTDEEAVYFDLAGRTAVSIGPLGLWLVGIGSVLLGLLAWWRVARGAVRAHGIGRLLVTLAWTVLGVAAVVVALLAAVWILRAAREVYHPWYAHPNRLAALLLAAGVTAGWTVFRLGTLLPVGMRGRRDPAIVWSFALPAWVALAVASMWLAPAAAFLWVLPLIAGAAGVLAIPPDRTGTLAVVSLGILLACALIWLRDTYLLFHFVVGLFGRLPLVTPVFVYPALVSAAAVILAPPLLAGLMALQVERRPPVVTASCLLAVVVTGALAYAAPAYTTDRPLRRQARFIQDEVSGMVYWEVGGVEPGIDLGPGSGLDWLPSREALPTSVPLPRLRAPFVFRAETTGSLPRPVDAVATVTVRGQDVELAILVRPREPGLTLAFVLPPGIVPLGANMPGRIDRDDRWTATFVGPPEEGLEFRAFFEPGLEGALGSTAVVATSSHLPGWSAGQRYPAWLTADRTAWRARAVYVWRPPRSPASLW